MEFKKFSNKYIMRIDKGEEIVSTIKEFCKTNSITLGTITGLGATNKAVVGLFETGNKQYHSKELTGDHEITGLIGNISTKDGEVYLHIHATITDINYNAFGGHLTSAVVGATCEVVIDSIEGIVERAFNDEIGLNLFKF